MRNLDRLARMIEAGFRRSRREFVMTGRGRCIEPATAGSVIVTGGNGEFWRCGQNDGICLVILALGRVNGCGGGLQLAGDGDCRDQVKPMGHRWRYQQHEQAQDQDKQPLDGHAFHPSIVPCTGPLASYNGGSRTGRQGPSGRIGGHGCDDRWKAPSWTGWNDRKPDRCHRPTRPPRGPAVQARRAIPHSRWGRWRRSGSPPAPGPAVSAASWHSSSAAGRGRHAPVSAGPRRASP